MTNDNIRSGNVSFEAHLTGFLLGSLVDFLSNISF